MYFYMKDEAAIIAGFANCLGGMLSTVAQEIKLNIRGCKGVTDLKVHKDDNMAKNKDGSVTVPIFISCNIDQSKELHARL